MIGLLILAVVLGYIFLSKLIVTKVYKSYGVKKANIALAIMVLIPTWDVILGFPVYAYLCATKAGVHIYKTVDNVEGFYVGEKDIANQPYEPYKGYKYIDYKEIHNGKPTGKYYRSYWVDYFKDRNESQYCVYPKYPNSSTHPYTRAFNEGRCIVKQEIPESEVSRWDTSLKKKKTNSFEIFLLGINLEKVGEIKDRKTNEILSEKLSVKWSTGWFFGRLFSFETGHVRNWNCGTSYSNVFEMHYKTLVNKQGDK